MSQPALAERRSDAIASAQRSPASSAPTSPYDALDKAQRRLGERPDDDGARLECVTGFARIGLCGIAADLLEERPEWVNSRPELREAVAAFRRRPQTVISRRAAQAQLERNLASANRAISGPAAWQNAVREASCELEIHACGDGNRLLCRRHDGGRRTWLPGIVDWPAQAACVDALPAGVDRLCPPVVVQGLGMGHALRRILARTDRMFLTFRPRIHVIEPNLAQCAAWMMSGDRSRELESGRLQIWLGDSACDDLIAYYRARPDESRPVCVVRQPCWGSHAPDGGLSAVRALSREDGEAEHRLLAQAREIYPMSSGFERFERAFAQRRERPLRILGVTSRFTTFLQYSMRDIGHAAEAAGHEFRLLIERDDHNPGLPRAYVLSQIVEFRPDLVLLIDHNRCEYGELYDFGVPYCNWIQDDLPNLFGPGRGASLHAYDLVVGLIGSLRADASGYPRGRWRSIPMPVSTKTYHTAPIDRATRRRFECDLSFVSNLSLTAEEHVARATAQCADANLKRLFAALNEEFRARILAGRVPASSTQAMNVTHSVALRLGLQLGPDAARGVQQLFTERLVNIHFRQQALLWAADLGLHVRLYGRGWEQHPQLGRFACGVAEHGEQLRAIYQASRINLQAMPSGAIHQRLLEGLCSGGFFLVRRTEFDTSGALAEAVRQRCLAHGYRNEEQLWLTPDATLAADVRALNERLYAPSRLYDGFVADQQVIAERGVPMEAGSVLPCYEQVAFGDQPEFAAACARYLAAEDERREIAERQRVAIADRFSYDAALERVLAFAQARFAACAALSRANTQASS